MNERLKSEQLAELALTLEKSKLLAAELAAVEERMREHTILIAENESPKPPNRPTS